ncbi:MAG TPA: hypothetical protein H9868_00150 [Candidatus Flavonifractor merdipullorum]|uniref:Uncharacterized protein n=1 Tax=Candidatus Flavonifractor merdipullorum TaxID=2838590 RepID=A0A9D1RUC5_9FIRM|nr:hypothetical protein [Candidatus Flavonifractor merdipullorum]
MKKKEGKENFHLARFARLPFFDRLEQKIRENFYLACSMYLLFFWKRAAKTRGMFHVKHPDGAGGCFMFHVKHGKQKESAGC